MFLCEEPALWFAAWLALGGNSAVCMLLSLLLVAASNDAACAAMGRPIRWGIMGSGLISSDFVGALKALPADEAEVIAVGARSLEAAQAFATSLGVPKAHAGYEALANDPDVDVVYVGTVAQTHADCARIALDRGPYPTKKIGKGRSVS